MQTNKTIIGSVEWVSLPQLNIPAIEARIDSGAKTSSLHALNIEQFQLEHQPWVRFDLYPIANNGKTIVRCEAKVTDQRIIKSSNGEKEKRYVIQTPITINGESWPIEITLTNRNSMDYRMLIGREAMSGKIIVDPDNNHIFGDKNNDEIDQLYPAVKVAKNGLKIGLLASNPELYSNRRIMESAERMGHEVHFLNIKHCYIKLDDHKPEIHYRGGTILNDLDAVIPRIRPSLTYYGCSLIRHFETLKIFSLNSSKSITQSRDKLYSLQLLLDNGVRIPTTSFANSPLETKDLINMVGGAPLIIKLLEGTQGKGVVLAETKKAAESVVNAFKSLNANILVQEFIKEANGKDLRCFVVDGKVVAAIERIAPAGEFRANIHLGATAKKVRITAEERRIAKLATKAMGLQVAGVDIIRSAKGPLLLEVNSSPGLEGIETITKIDIAQILIQTIEKKLNWKKEG